MKKIRHQHQLIRKSRRPTRKIRVGTSSGSRTILVHRKIVKKIKHWMSRLGKTIMMKQVPPDIFKSPSGVRQRRVGSTYSEFTRQRILTGLNEIEIRIKKSGSWGLVGLEEWN